jgi:hypothetical protein
LRHSITQFMGKTKSPIHLAAAFRREIKKRNLPLRLIKPIKKSAQSLV